jgi:carboxypeptidase Taq
VVEEKIRRLKELINLEDSYNHVISLLHWDMETETPIKGIEKAGATLEAMVNEMLNKTLNPEVKELLDYLNYEKEKLKEIDRAIVKDMKRNYDKMIKIPKAMVSRYERLKSEAQNAWKQAYDANSFEIFAPYLEKLIEFNIKFIEYRGYKKNPYNTLLDDYEQGMTVEKLDEFFSYLKRNLIPIIDKAIYKYKNLDTEFLNFKMESARQKKLSEKLLSYVGFDFDRGLLKESKHPFTLNFSRNDVRITTHYYPKNFISSIYSTLHECGHALYEQNIDSYLDSTPVGQGASMGIHESQSRLFENYFGKNYDFLKGLYPYIQDEVYELKSVDFDKFYLALNKPTNSTIRTEADELTYTMHILVRYELEKMIFNKEIKVKDLPAEWNKKMKEYLGIEPVDVREGILQDIHWAAGLFGYFPSYALGNAYAAQINNKMKVDIDLENLLFRGDFEVIKNYLTEKIYKYGKLLTPEEIILKSTGENLNPYYYVDYLKTKYLNSEIE